MSTILIHGNCKMIKAAVLRLQASRCLLGSNRKRDACEHTSWSPPHVRMDFSVWNDFSPLFTSYAFLKVHIASCKTLFKHLLC